MQLVVDVGNTETVVGLASSTTELVADWRVSSSVPRTADEMTALIRAFLTGDGIDEDTTILFLCRSGQRSIGAAIALTEAGYGKSYNVLEGFEGNKDDAGHRGRTGGWKVAGLPWTQG